MICNIYCMWNVFEICYFVKQTIKGSKRKIENDKNGEFCIYNDNEYELNEDSDGNLIIITTNRAIIDETFVDKYNSGVYSKVILPNEIGEAYDCQTYGVIKGSRVNVEKENEEYYFVGTADCKVAEALGLQRCDKYYYEGKFPKQDVEIIEEKEKIEL